MKLTPILNSLYFNVLIHFNPLPHRDAFQHYSKQSRPRSGCTCKTRLIRALFAYGNMIRYDPILVDLTSNLFVRVCHAFLSMHCDLVVMCWEGLTFLLSCMWCFIVFMSLSHIMSWVRCGAWLHRFRIVVFYLTLMLNNYQPFYEGFFLHSRNLHEWSCFIEFI